jgi:hypothetical protein
MICKSQKCAHNKNLLAQKNRGGGGIAINLGKKVEGGGGKKAPISPPLSHVWCNGKQMSYYPDMKVFFCLVAARSSSLLSSLCVCVHTQFSRTSESSSDRGWWRQTELRLHWWCWQQQQKQLVPECVASISLMVFFSHYCYYYFAVVVIHIIV